MKVNGIIAEYNPFHNGHKYQLEESLRLTGADYTVVVMSGNFVQRGAPALLDKHTRAEMALRGGADLVLELPTLCAVSSAEYFAAGAVALLDKLGIITHLCFGSECGETEPLRRIALCLSDQHGEYDAALRRRLKEGLSYPQARARALAEVYSTAPQGFPCTTKAHGLTSQDSPATAEAHGLMSQDCPPTTEAHGPTPPDCLCPAENCGACSDSGSSLLPPESLDSLLSSPNNILGIEYIRALLRRKSSIVPVTVKRLGAGYHDGFLTGSDSSSVPSGSPCSAFAIRQTFREGNAGAEPDLHMPPESEALLRAWIRENRPVHPDDFSSLLYYKLLTEREYGYEKYLDVSADLSHRIRNQLNRFAGYEDFCGLLKTRNMTYTRISRCLLHILLGLEKEDMEAAKALDYVPYARVLGFRRRAKPLLGAVSRRASIPLVTKMADAQKSLSDEAYRLLKHDMQAGDLFRRMAFEGSGKAVGSELSLPPVIL